MKGTTINFTTEQLSDITFSLNQTITYYEAWEKETLLDNVNEINNDLLAYIRNNIKTFKSIKNKILNKAK